MAAATQTAPKSTPLDKLLERTVAKKAQVTDLNKSLKQLIAEATALGKGKITIPASIVKANPGLEKFADNLTNSSSALLEQKAAVADSWKPVLAEVTGDLTHLQKEVAKAQKVAIKAAVKKVADAQKASVKKAAALAKKSEAGVKAEKKSRAKSVTKKSRAKSTDKAAAAAAPKKAAAAKAPKKAAAAAAAKPAAAKKSRAKSTDKAAATKAPSAPVKKPRVKRSRASSEEAAVEEPVAKRAATKRVNNKRYFSVAIDYSADEPILACMFEGHDSLNFSGLPVPDGTGQMRDVWRSSELRTQRQALVEFRKLVKQYRGNKEIKEIVDINVYSSKDSSDDALDLLEDHGTLKLM
jgi:hypothetical protein